MHSSKFVVCGIWNILGLVYIACYGVNLQSTGSLEVELTVQSALAHPKSDRAESW